MQFLGKIVLKKKTKIFVFKFQTKYFYDVRCNNVIYLINNNFMDIESILSI